MSLWTEVRDGYTGASVLDGLTQGGQATQTTSNEFNSTVRPYIEDAFQQLSETSAPTYFPGSTVAPQSADTTSGLSGLSDAASAQAGIGNTAVGGFNFTMNDMLNPASNSALQSYITGAINPIFDRLENKTLPGIGGQAIQAGQFGGTAQTNLMRDALTDAERNAFDTSSAIASNAYTTSLDNYTNTLLNADKLQKNVSTPAQTLLTSGAMQDARSQQELDAEIARHNFEQTGDFNYLTSYINTLLGVPMDSTTVTKGGDTSPYQVAASILPYAFLL